MAYGRDSIENIVTQYHCWVRRNFPIINDTAHFVHSQLRRLSRCELFEYIKMNYSKTVTYEFYIFV